MEPGLHLRFALGSSVHLDGLVAAQRRLVCTMTLSQIDALVYGAVILGRWLVHMFDVLEQLQYARVFLKLCSLRGAASGRIQLAPWTPRLRYRLSIPIYAMSQLMQRHRSSMMGCGCVGKVAALISHGTCGPVHQNCPQLMDFVARRVVARRGGATPQVLHVRAMCLWVAGQGSAAIEQILPRTFDACAVSPTGSASVGKRAMRSCSCGVRAC